MNGYDSSDDHQPVTWFRGHPVYAAHLIVVGFVASMLVTTIFAALGIGHLLNIWLGFTSALVLKGEIWRIFTYGLVNPPSLQFALDMAMIVWFGREVERFFGRRRFFVLYAVLYVLSPVLFTLIGVRWPIPAPIQSGGITLTIPFTGETGAFALFIAFATLYPNVPLLFNILAKWAALILVSLFSLMAIASRDRVGLISLWATVGFAHAFVRYEQGHFSLPRFSLFRAKPKLRVLPDPEPKRSAAVAAEKENAMAEVDALLDKIARSGISSLTAKERAKLDAAGAQLTKRRR
jgi:membrane associated rhomboid family serine protease